MSVFVQAEAANRLWKDYRDIHRDMLDQWGRIIQNSNIDVEAVQFQPLIAEKELSDWLKPYTGLIAAANEELAVLAESVAVPHFFMIADVQGAVVHIVGSRTILEKLRHYQIRPGISCALEHAGINGISFSMETQSLAVIEGREHTLRMLEDWTCICIPIYVSNKLIGYLDLSVKQGSDICFMVALLERAAESIGHKLARLDPDCRRSSLYNRFDPYKLSPRQKEVAFYWLHNQSALQIGARLGVTEGTIRNILKKIYAKTGVSRKGQFMSNFME